MADNKYAKMALLAQQYQATEPENDAPVPGRVGRPPGKRSNPNFERLTVLVKKQTRKAAQRLWEDIEPGRDMSELVERLLTDFIQHHRDSAHTE
jgi:hypothetical protein